MAGHNQHQRSSAPSSTAAASAPPSNMRNTDLLAVRAYVTAHDGFQEQQLHANTVLADLTHSNLKQQILEIRIDQHSPVTFLYELFHQKTGSAVGDQRLSLFDGMGECVCPQLPSYQSPEAARPLGYFLNPQSSSRRIRIHCVDSNPLSVSARGALEDTSLVDKYVMSDETYAARTGTLKRWAQEQKEADPSFTLQKHAAQHQAMQQAVRCHKQGLPLPEGFVLENGKVVAMSVPEKDAESWDQSSVAHVTVGDRCQIQPGGRRGRVAWVGSIAATAGKNKDCAEDAPSYWVGIVLDEPVGRNDGTWAPTGERYFDAAPKYGVFCRGPNVETGDFPERSLWDSDDDDDEDEL